LRRSCSKRATRDQCTSRNAGSSCRGRGACNTDYYTEPPWLTPWRKPWSQLAVNLCYHLSICRLVRAPVSISDLPSTIQSFSPPALHPSILSPPPSPSPSPSAFPASNTVQCFLRPMPH